MNRKEIVIRKWFEVGKDRRAEYLIIVYDNYYQEERPVFVFPEQNIQHEVVLANTEWTRVLYILCLLRDINEQIIMAMIPAYRAVSTIEH